MNQIFCALGGNVGNREENFLKAATAFSLIPETRLVRCSPVYETPPVGVTDQPAFLNAVVELDSTQSPHALLKYMQAIEHSLGRKRDVQWGPRTIDLDLILYGFSEIQDLQLTVPHPHFHQRSFVLAPLADLAPDLIPPGFDTSIRQLRDAQDDLAAISRYDFQQFTWLT